MGWLVVVAGMSVGRGTLIVWTRAHYERSQKWGGKKSSSASWRTHPVPSTKTPMLKRSESYANKPCYTNWLAAKLKKDTHSIDLTLLSLEQKKTILLSFFHSRTLIHHSNFIKKHLQSEKVSLPVSSASFV